MRRTTRVTGRAALCLTLAMGATACSSSDDSGGEAPPSQGGSQPPSGSASKAGSADVKPNNPAAQLRKIAQGYDAADIDVENASPSDAEAFCSTVFGSSAQVSRMLGKSVNVSNRGFQPPDEVDLPDGSTKTISAATCSYQSRQVDPGVSAVPGIDASSGPDLVTETWAKHTVGVVCQVRPLNAKKDSDSSPFRADGLELASSGAALLYDDPQRTGDPDPFKGYVIQGDMTAGCRATPVFAELIGPPEAHGPVVAAQAKVKPLYENAIANLSKVQVPAAK